LGRGDLIHPAPLLWNARSTLENTLKTSKAMQGLITQIAAKHGLDLSAEEAHLRLEQNGYMPLVIEKIGQYRVSVAHYFRQNGDSIADPDVVFFTGYSEWVPIEIQQVMGYSRYTELAADETTIERFAPRGQADLASFVHQWARNIKAQGWLEHGVNVASKKSEAKAQIP